MGQTNANKEEAGQSPNKEGQDKMKGASGEDNTD